MTLFDKRIEQMKYVVNNSNFVTINNKQIDEFIKKVDDLTDYKHWLYEYKSMFTENEIILFVFLVESMNFCFWLEPIFKYNNTKKSEAMFNIWLNKTLKDKRLLDLNYLKDLTYSDLISIFEIEEGNLKNRYNSLMHTVNVIHNKENFYNELFAIKSIDSLYEYIVNEFINFKDVSMYKGKEIYFYKRATLLINDLFELSDTIKNNIKSIDACLGCADYVIPKGLRSLGILEYNAELSEIVDAEEFISKDSEYEVEIRANMLFALEILKQKLKNNGIFINSVRLDNIIWQKSRGKEGKNHKTNTIYY